MADSGPFVKKFEFGGGCFIYDVNTNQIVEVERIVYDVVDRRPVEKTLLEAGSTGLAYSDEEMVAAVEAIRDAFDEHGLFSSHRPKRLVVGIYSGADVRRIHESGFPQMVLELTMECNLDCRYCKVSGHYSATENRSLHMSRDVLFEAIDFYYEKSVDAEHSHISFYGGEPLLKFDLMKQAVEYVRQKTEGAKYTFSFTTNGTLFDKEMIDFFIKNDFSLLISLDGPKSMHDRYRVYRDGGGTYDAIVENLELIRHLNPEYFKRNVSVTCVVAPPFDEIDGMFDFFSSHHLFKDMRDRGRVRASFVDTSETGFLKNIGLNEQVMRSSGVIGKFIDRFKQSLLDGNRHFMSIEKGVVFPIIYGLARRQVCDIGDYIAPNGACQLGSRRFFVRTNGDIQICEKGGECYKLGHVQAGFDYDCIVSYYRKMEERMQDCTDCWAMIYCSRCWVHVGDLDKFNGEEKERFCNINKATILEAFKVYGDLLNTDPDCLKIFKDIVVS